MRLKIDLPHTDMMEIFYKNHDCEVTELQSAIQRVRELHKPSEVWAGNYECIECSPNSCGCCSYVEYPCPTIQALDGEQ